MWDHPEHEKKEKKEGHGSSVPSLLPPHEPPSGEVHIHARLLPTASRLPPLPQGGRHTFFPPPAPAIAGTTMLAGERYPLEQRVSLPSPRSVVPLLSGKVYSGAVSSGEYHRQGHHSSSSSHPSVASEKGKKYVPLKNARWSTSSCASSPWRWSGSSGAVAAAAAAALARRSCGAARSVECLRREERYWSS